MCIYHVELMSHTACQFNETLSSYRKNVYDNMQWLKFLFECQAVLLEICDARSYCITQVLLLDVVCKLLLVEGFYVRFYDA